MVCIESAGCARGAHFFGVGHRGRAPRCAARCPGEGRRHREPADCQWALLWGGAASGGAELELSL